MLQSLLNTLTSHNWRLRDEDPQQDDLFNDLWSKTPVPKTYPLLYMRRSVTATLMAVVHAEAPDLSSWSLHQTGEAFVSPNTASVLWDSEHTNIDEPIGRQPVALLTCPLSCGVLDVRCDRIQEGPRSLAEE